MLLFLQVCKHVAHQRAYILTARSVDIRHGVVVGVEDKGISALAANLTQYFVKTLLQRRIHVGLGLLEQAGSFFLERHAVVESSCNSYCLFFRIEGAKSF